MNENSINKLFIKYSCRLFALPPECLDPLLRIALTTMNSNGTVHHVGLFCSQQFVSFTEMHGMQFDPYTEEKWTLQCFNEE